MLGGLVQQGIFSMSKIAKLPCKWIEWYDKKSFETREYTFFGKTNNIDYYVFHHHIKKISYVPLSAISTNTTNINFARLKKWVYKFYSKMEIYKKHPELI